jgi:hypothetical protein
MRALAALTVLSLASCGTPTTTESTSSDAPTISWSLVSESEESGEAFAFECVDSGTLPPTARVAEYEATNGSTGVSVVTGTFASVADASAWVAKAAPPAFACLAPDATIETQLIPVVGSDEAQRLLIETDDGPVQALQVQRSGASVTMLIATAPDQVQAEAALDDAQPLVP